MREEIEKLSGQLLMNPNDCDLLWQRAFLYEKANEPQRVLYDLVRIEQLLSSTQVKPPKGYAPSLISAMQAKLVVKQSSLAKQIAPSATTHLVHLGEEEGEFLRPGLPFTSPPAAAAEPASPTVAPERISKLDSIIALRNSYIEQGILLNCFVLEPKKCLTLVSKLIELRKSATFPTTGLRICGVIRVGERHSFAIDIKVHGDRISIIMVDSCGEKSEQLRQFRKELIQLLRLEQGKVIVFYKISSRCNLLFGDVQYLALIILRY